MRRRLFSWKNSNFLNQCDNFSKIIFKKQFKVLFNYKLPKKRRWFFFSSNLNLLAKCTILKKSTLSRKGYRSDKWVYFNTNLFKKLTLLQKILNNKLHKNIHRLIYNNRFWNLMFFTNPLSNYSGGMFLLKKTSNNSIKFFNEIFNNYGLVKLNHPNHYSLYNCKRQLLFQPFDNVFKLRRMLIVAITFKNELTLINELNLPQEKLNHDLIINSFQFNKLFDENSLTNLQLLFNLKRNEILQTLKIKEITYNSNHQVHYKSLKHRLTFYFLFNLLI